MDRKNYFWSGVNILESLYNFLILFRLLIHYEMGNHELLTSLIRNSQRTLKLHSTYLEIEKVFFLAISRLISSDSYTKNEVFENLIEEIARLQQDKFNRPILEFLILRLG